MNYQVLADGAAIWGCPTLRIACADADFYALQRKDVKVVVEDANGLVVYAAPEKVLVGT